MTRLDIFISIASYKAHGAFIWMSAAPCLNTRRGHAARAQFHGQMEQHLICLLHATLLLCFYK